MALKDWQVLTFLFPCQSPRRPKLVRLINRNGCDLPYFSRVLGDRAVAGELARSGNVQDDLASPYLGVRVGLAPDAGALRRSWSGRPVVAMAQKRVYDRREEARLVTAEVVSRDQVKCGTGLRFVLVVPPRTVPAAAALDLFGGQAEQKEVLLLRGFRHFDGRAVPRANSQGAVHHELHVARAAGLVTGGRDLLRDVTGRDELLGDRDTVVRHEDHSDTPMHRGVAVNGARDVIDELDDELGEVIGWRGLAGEEERARRHIKSWIRAQPIVEHNHMQHVQELPLVFVDALDLRVEERLWIDDRSAVAFQPVSKSCLGFPLGPTDRVAEALVVRQRLQFLQL